MSMESLRRTAQSITNKQQTKSSNKSAYFRRWKPPQIVAATGMGNSKVSINLKNFLAAPPSEEAELEVSEPIVMIRGAYPDIYAVDANGNKDTQATSEGLHLR